MRGAALIGGCLLALAAVAQGQPMQNAAEDALRRMNVTAADLMSLQRVDPLPEDLRREAESLATAHLERMKGVFERWIAEERRRIFPAPLPHTLLGWVRARWINELALWQLDSAGADDDSRWRRQQLLPGVCEHASTASLYAQRIARIALLPASERPQALAAEGARLARWGTVRNDVPPWPYPLPDRRLRQALAEAHAAGASVEPPMTATLAARVSGDANWHPGANKAVRCEAWRWWLQRSATDDAEATLVARFGMVQLPYGTEAAGASVGSDGFPHPARVFGVEGVVAVAVIVGDQGRVRDAEVVGRTITAAVDRRAARPVAFEAMLDDASLNRARAIDFAPFRPGPDGVDRRRVEIVWKLK